ncbi:MAG: bis(5'-nucleosyl)-tetraphosphatase (symmetrical) YqeK [bacterium]|nr:bis(5'-nucleosyl)-tetraphosphatase (symmetrical) YqeK [bacterium]
MAYINNREIYISFLEKHLSKERVLHTLAVEKEAIFLAERYGVDICKASLAALLHDCAKGFSDEELVELAKSYNIPLSIWDLSSPQILHAPVGSMFAREYFGIKDGDILSAIWKHTTGDKEMSTLDKIIFIADYIEYNRNFPGISHLREIVKKDLNSAILFAISLTVSYIMRNNFVIHPKTIEVWNHLIKEVKEI